MKGLKQLRRKIAVFVILSGILLGLAIFTKVPALTMIPLVGYLIYRNTRNSIKYLGLWLIPVIAIPLAWPIFANSIGPSDDWLVAFQSS